MKKPQAAVPWSKKHRQQWINYANASHVIVDESELTASVDALLTGQGVRHKLSSSTKGVAMSNDGALCLKFAVKDRLVMESPENGNDLEKAWHGTSVRLLASILMDGKLKNSRLLTKPNEPCVYCFSDATKEKAAGYAAWQPCLEPGYAVRCVLALSVDRSRKIDRSSTRLTSGSSLKAPWRSRCL